MADNWGHNKKKKGKKEYINACLAEPESAFNHWFRTRWFSVTSICLMDGVKQNVLDDLHRRNWSLHFRSKVENNLMRGVAKQVTCDIRPCTCSTVILALSRVILARGDSSCKSWKCRYQVCKERKLVGEGKER